MRGGHRFPARSRHQSPGRAFWGNAFAQEHLVDLAGNSQLGFQMLDALPGGLHLDGLIGAGSLLLAKDLPCGRSLYLGFRTDPVDLTRPSRDFATRRIETRSPGRFLYALSGDSVEQVDFRSMRPYTRAGERGPCPDVGLLNHRDVRLDERSPLVNSSANMGAWELKRTSTGIESG